MTNNREKWAVKAAGAGALALLLAVPTFAQSRGGSNARRNDRGRTETQRRDSAPNRAYRDNERVSVQGKV